MARDPSRRPTLPVEWILLATCLWLVAFANGAWWSAFLQGRASNAPETWGSVVLVATMLAGLHFAILAIVVNRWTFRPLLTAVVVASTAAAYYMTRYAVVMDPTMIQNALRTDAREAGELLSLGFVGHTLAWSALPVAFVWWVQPDRRPLLRSLGFRAASIVVAVLVATLAFLAISRDFTALMRNERQMRYLATPGNLLYGLAHQFREDVALAGTARSVVAGDAHRAPGTPGARPRVLVIVLGETARADRFELLGHVRPTNPELRALDVLAFRDVTSCGTSTEISVPCMFSVYGRAAYDERRIRSSENVLDVLVRAGFAVKWLENQSGCKGVCEGAGIATRRLDAGFAPDLCAGDDCLDEILVRALEQDLATVRSDTVYVLHMMGNHGPTYYRRYPPGFARFRPECRSAELRTCSVAEIRNSFDNAILYTDHVLAGVVRSLAERERQLAGAMLYVSDHGESLGEGGLYLHGMPYAIAPRTQTHVPMVVWLSRPFVEISHMDERCLAARTTRPWSHDNLFDSFLGVLDVRTVAYRRERDIFSGCRES